MASPNPFAGSPLEQLAVEQEALARIEPPSPAAPAMPDLSQASMTPDGTAAPTRPRASAANYIPPANLRPVFDAAAQQYDIPVNVLMALGHQESSYNPTAVGTSTEWGRAKGIMQYLDDAANGLGINPFDPGQAIPAAAKQIRERLDQGYSMEDAVKEHFAGPDRKLWGKKTAIYGREVMDKAFQISELVLGGRGAQADEVRPAGIPDDWVRATPEQEAAYEAQQANHFTTAMPRDTYQRTFLANNPGASPAAMAHAMQQYDQQAAARAGQNGVATRFDVLKSPEATFDAKLNQRLAGPAKGIVPPLPEKLTRAPEATMAPQPGVVDDAGDAARSLKIGADAAAQDVRELVGRIPAVGGAIVEGVDAVDQYFSGKPSDQLLADDVKRMTQGMTPQMQAALGKKWWDGDKGTFGAAWSDPRSYLGGVLQSLPEQALTMVPAMALAKASYAAKIAAGAAEAVAAQSAARTATLAGGLSEGLLGGAQSARAVREHVTALPQATLDQSEAYRAMLAAGAAPAAARKALAEDVATRAFITSGVVTGMFGGMGDRAIAKLFTEAAGPSVVRNAVNGFGKGALAEGLLEELPQSAGQQLAQNAAMRRADPNQSLGEDVANQALGGAVQGGLQGGGMGAMAAAVPRPVPASQVAPLPADVVPAAPASGSPLTSSVAHAAAQPARVIVTNAEGNSAPGTVRAYQEDGEGGFAAEIIGDDGQVYTITDGDGLQLTPVAPAPGPLTASLEGAAEADQSDIPTLTDIITPGNPDGIPTLTEIITPGTPDGIPVLTDVIEPAPEPAAPTIESAPIAAPVPAKTPEQPAIADMDDANLRDRMKYLATQFRNANDRGIQKKIATERRQVEAEINRRAAAPTVQGGDNAEPIAADGTGNVGGGSRQVPVRNEPADGRRSGADRPLPGHGRGDAGLDGGKDAADLPAASGTTDAQLALTELDAAAHEAATSPTNDLAEPTDAQKEAGNYKKGRITVQGLDISVENPRGSARSGKRPDGSTWAHTMSDHYGYIKRTTGADGEQIDVYVGPNPESQRVFVVDQLNQGDGSFDEHKIMLGYGSKAAAVKAYKSNFDKGWKVGPVKDMTVDEFKTWLKDGDTAAPATGAAPAEKVPDVAPSAESKTPATAKSVRDTRGKNVRFHGTSRPLPDGKPNNEYAMSGDNRNIYGQGFYTTDAADISQGYMRKGRGGAPTLYEIGERGDIKLYDMDQPMSGDVRAMVRGVMGEDFPDYDMDGNEVATLRGVFDEYRDESKNSGMTRDDVQEVFDSVRYNLEQQGYRGYRHVGGEKTGKQPHDVRIYWMPEDDIDVKQSDIAHYEGDEDATAPAAAQKNSKPAPIATKRWEYPASMGNSEGAQKTNAAQRAVVDFMNGDIDKPELISKLADLELQSGVLASVTNRLGNDFLSDDSQTVKELAKERKREALASEPQDDAADIPLAFMKKTKVPMEVWIKDEGAYETIDVPADQALTSVRDDIVNLRSLLDCLRG